MIQAHHKLLASGLVLLLVTAAAVAEQAPWRVDHAPYRIGLTLNRPIDRPTVLALDAQAVIDAIAPVAVDQLNHDTLAFERVVLVNPRTGAAVGRFQLVPAGQPLAIDGSFQALREGKPPWLGFMPDRMRFETVTLDGAPRQALMIREEAVANRRVMQTVQLVPQQYYLLDYWIMCDVTDNSMNVMLHHPDLRLFSPVYHSYVSLMPPQGEWRRHRVLFRPEDRRTAPGPMDIDLRITHAFIGHCGVAQISLRPMAWRLIVEPDEPLGTLELYVSARAGHRLPVPTDELIAESPPRNPVLATLGEPRSRNLNSGAVRVGSDGMTAWTVDPALPLKVQAIRAYEPSEDTGVEAARVDVFHGGSASLVIALDTGRPRLDDLQVATDLPADVTFHRLATIPVYDGPTVRGELKGRLIETRYEAMVPLDYTLDPDSDNGIHLVVATITPRDDTPAGSHRGQVTLSFAGKTITIPVDLRCASLRLKPAHHFGTLFGASAFLVARPAGTADMAEDAISIATFHGLSGEDLSLRPRQDIDEDSTSLLALTRKYFHTLLDHHLSPRSPALYRDFAYTVTDRGPGLAPDLSDWDFSHGYDQAIDEFVIGRNMPWLTVYHTNGHLMHQLRLRNGKTYSVEPNPDDPNWVHLSRDEFDRLIGDYFDGFARYLDGKGVLDRAILVIDESGTETYDTIYAWVMAMRQRSYAGRIRIGHTIQKTATWTRRLPDGRLLMEEVLDVPMPVNDEHYNYFEPEWNARFTKPGLIHWVYQVESDHINLENAGLSTLLLPLKLGHFGVEGWYDWECFMWSLPYAYLEGQRGSMKYGTGPVGNPWVNPFYHHGPGVLSFFYPPDPRGPAEQPTHLVIPSFRLTLMRDGIQERALLEALRSGADDAGRALHVDAAGLKEAESRLATLWADNTVQWHLDYHTHRTVRQILFDLAMEQNSR